MTHGVSSHGQRHDWAHGLLVSVRAPGEAVVALAGAAIVDVKEPLRGPLGRADASVAADVLRAVTDRAVVTLACGELTEGLTSIVHYVEDVLRCVTPGVQRPVAIKAGPSGLTKDAWLERFRSLRASLPDGIESVAVAYADWRKASCLSPDELFVAAASSGTRLVLVDTFDKAGPGLFELVDPPELHRWMTLAHDRGLALALAGKLTEADVAAAFRLGVDVVGVRSAVCNGGRLGRIDPARVQALGRLTVAWQDARIPTPPGALIP